MQIKKVGVIGCGLMGHGIAQVAATGGCDVVVVETEQKFLDTGLGRIDKSLAKLAEKAKEKGGSFDAAPVRARIKGSLDRKSVADCDLVVEAIVENLEIKNQLFAELGKVCKPSTIFAAGIVTVAMSSAPLPDPHGSRKVYMRSKIPAAPIPPPTHIVTRP